MRTVLVIDDTPAVAKALSVMFGLHEIQTRAASDPEAGLAMLAEAARERVRIRRDRQRRP